VNSPPLRCYETVEFKKNIKFTNGKFINIFDSVFPILFEIVKFWPSGPNCKFANYLAVFMLCETLASWPYPKKISLLTKIIFVFTAISYAILLAMIFFYFHHQQYYEKIIELMALVEFN
jgi:hypothetical protein